MGGCMWRVVRVYTPFNPSNPPLHNPRRHDHTATTTRARACWRPSSSPPRRAHPMRTSTRTPSSPASTSPTARRTCRVVSLCVHVPVVHRLLGLPPLSHDPYHQESPLPLNHTNHNTIHIHQQLRRRHLLRGRRRVAHRHGRRPGGERRLCLWYADVEPFRPLWSSL